jgi:hypothetical protein
MDLSNLIICQGVVALFGAVAGAVIGVWRIPKVEPSRNETVAAIIGGAIIGAIICWFFAFICGTAMYTFERS